VWTHQDVDLGSPSRSLCRLHIGYGGVCARSIELMNVVANEVGFHVQIMSMTVDTVTLHSQAQLQLWYS
jgi:hypothetical protein